MIKGSSRCLASGLVLKQGKTNQAGRIDMTGCMRNARVEICTLMLMGFDYFCRYHVAHQTFPNFAESSNWFDLKLFTGSRQHGQGSLTKKMA